MVHTLSPNVYRTPSEALQAFHWFDKAGDWRSHFSIFERCILVYFGAAIMWLLSKNLKRKYGLKDDVRQSLYDEINIWLKKIKANGTIFMGGDDPGE